VGGVERLNRVEGDIGVVGDGKICEPFGVAEFDGDDVLEELGTV
jgi:hypothetical protein